MRYQFRGRIFGGAYTWRGLFWNFTVYYFINILVAIALIIIPTITALTLLLIPGKETDLFKFFFSVKKNIGKYFHDFHQYTHYIYQ